MAIGIDVAQLFVLAIPVACISWTVTHEEVFREPREYCAEQSRTAPGILRRKFFYLFTCEYCFSHYISALFVLMTRFMLLYYDWRGYVIAWFSLVWIANQYMGVFNRLRLEIKSENVEIKAKEEQLEKN